MAKKSKGLQALDAEGRSEDIIAELRGMVAEDKQIFTDRWVKEWVGRRWRELFLQEAVKDARAVEAASKPALLARAPLPSALKKSNPRQAIAERFLRDIRATEWQDEGQPPAQYDKIENTTLVICPGLLTGLLHSEAHAFAEEAPELLAERGWKVLRADLHPFRGCEANGADLEAAVARGEGFDAEIKPVTDPEPPGDVFLLGYSKGTPDILQFLVDYPQYTGKVKAVYTWAGAVGGSYSADAIYNQIKDLDVERTFEFVSGLLSLVSPAMLSKAGIRRLDEYDILGAFNDLTTWNRESFVKDNKDYLNELGIPFFGITGSVTPFEVPNFQFLDAIKITGHDANNDMQLTQKQATLDIDMSTHLAMAHAHHWDLAYAPFPMHMRAASPNLDHPFPRKSALVANWELLAELGLIS